MREISVGIERFSVRELLERVRSGRWSLWLPSFQRSFVWDGHDMRQYLESLIRGYPTGILLLWRAERPEEADPFAVRIDAGLGPISANGEHLLIVDGQQRVLTLLMAASGWRIRVGGSAVQATPISINLRRLTLELGTRGADLSKAVRAAMGWEDVDELRRMHREEDVQSLLELADRLLGYELPAYVMRIEGRDALKVAADVFVLANRAGQRISNVELLLSYVSGALLPEAAGIVRRAYDEFQRDFHQLDSNALIRYAFGTLGLKQREIDDAERLRSAVERLSAQIDLTGRTVLAARVDEALPYFGAAIELVRMAIGRAAPEFMPGQLPLVTLAAFLRRREVRNPATLGKEELEAIRDWLILVGFHGYYSTSPSSRLQRDLDAVEGMRPRDPFPLRDLLENVRRFREGAASISRHHLMRGIDADLTRRGGRPYLFVLYAALCMSGATDWEGVLVRELPASRLARHHIFPKAYLQRHRMGDEEEGLASGLGNVTLISPELNAEIGDRPPAEYLPSYSRELESHFIPAERELWSPERLEEFCERRVRLIHEFLSRALPGVVEG
ncbi:MAG: DUF262 domain-containing protein [Nitrososphaerota archaeon]